MSVILFMDTIGFSERGNIECRNFMQELNDYIRYLLRKEFRTIELLCNYSMNVVALPTGDGMAICYNKGDGISVLKTAFKIQQWSRDNSTFKLRFGLYTGDLEEIEDINRCRNVCGYAINMTQRIMDCGFEDHIICSDSMYSEYFTDLNKHQGFEDIIVKDIGEYKVKHGKSFKLYNIFGKYKNKSVGNEEPPETKWHLHVEIDPDPKGRAFILTKSERYLKAKHIIFVGITNERLAKHLKDTIIEKKNPHGWEIVEIFFLYEKLLNYYWEGGRTTEIRINKQKEAINNIKEILVQKGDLVQAYTYETFPNFGMTCLDYDKPDGLIIIRPYIWGESSRDCPAIYYNWDERKPNKIYERYKKGIDKLRNAELTKRILPDSS
jgi:hypothetical protein